MTATDFRAILEQERNLKVGDSVTVRWGYGLGFRAHGQGVIERIFPKSFRVRLIEDVPHNGGVGWHKGFVLMGIPRFPAEAWQADSNSVEVQP